jgi:hypothetical protein
MIAYRCLRLSMHFKERILNSVIIIINDTNIILKGSMAADAI